jgi:hypothetical protein
MTSVLRAARSPLPASPLREPSRRRAALAALALALVLLSTACDDLVLQHVATGSGGAGTTTSGGSAGAGGNASSGVGGGPTGGSGGGTTSSSGGSTTSSSGTGMLLLGDPQIEPNTDHHLAGLADASSFHALSDGTVQTITVYYDDDAGGDATRLLVGLYADTGGVPSTRLATGTIDNPVPNAWNQAKVSPLVTLVHGQQYWLAILGPAGYGSKFGFRYRDGVTGNTVHSDEGAVLSELPDPWLSGPGFPATRCSFYASE